MNTETVIVKLAESSKDWADYLSLAANVLGPLLAAIFGIWILLITKKIEHSQWRNQKLIEKRIAVWDDVAPRLNDIYCYCMRVGAWKNVLPKDVIDWKREVDKKIHTYRPYYSAEFYTRYMAFMSVCFATYQGYGVDAKLKTPIDEHKSAHANWQAAWENYFYEIPSDEAELKDRYRDLQQQLSLELNVR